MQVLQHLVHGVGHFVLLVVNLIRILPGVYTQLIIMRATPSLLLGVNTCRTYFRNS